MGRRIELSKDKIAAYAGRCEAFFLYLLVFALPFSKAAIEISASLAIASWILRRAFEGAPGEKAQGRVNCWARFRPAATYLNIPIYLYIAVGVFSVALSSNFRLSLSSFGSKTMEYIMLYFIIAEFIVQGQRLKKIVTVFLVSLSMVAVDCIAQYLVGFDLLRLHPLEAGRITGSFQMPAGLAGYLGPLVCLPLAMSFLRFKKRSVGYALRVLAVLLLTLLIATFSRGAWLGLLAGILFLGFFQDKKVFLAAVVVLLLLLAILPHLLQGPYSIGERAASFFSLSSVANMDRKVIWQICLQMIKDRPLFGHGFSTFMGNFSRYGQQYYAFTTTGIVPYAHNCYLQIAAEMGIFGLLSFLFLIGKFFIYSVKALSVAQRGLYRAAFSGISAGIVVTLVHSAVDTNLYSLQLSVLFWLMLGINTGLIRGVDFEKS